MNVSVRDVEETELVRRAEAGQEIVLTPFGQPAARLVPVIARATVVQRRAIARSSPPC
jgi:prevent-host-death family protein